MNNHYYKHVVSKLQPNVSFGYKKNKFGMISNFTSQYENDLFLLHEKNIQNLYEKFLKFKLDTTWIEFEQNKTSLYEKEYENLVILKDNDTNIIYKLQRIETFYDQEDLNDFYSNTYEYFEADHFREILIQKLVYEIMLLSSDNDILCVPQIFDTYSIKLDSSLFSVIEMEDVGIDFSDYIMSLDTKEQRSLVFAQVGIKLLKTLTFLNNYIGFVHFDAKLNNILVKNNKYYLIDYGMSHVIYKDIIFSNDLSDGVNVSFISDIVFYIYHSLGLSFCSDEHIFNDKVIDFCSEIIIQLPKEINKNLCDKLIVAIYKLIYIKRRKTFNNFNFPSKFYQIIREILH